MRVLQGDRTLRSEASESLYGYSTVPALGKVKPSMYYLGRQGQSFGTTSSFKLQKQVSESYPNLRGVALYHK